MGDGVPENYAKGIKFIRKAAELNNIGGQVFLGLMYSSGKVEGIEKDYDEAKKWFAKAIEQELPSDALTEPSFKAEFTELKGLAQLNLGIMYHKGLGVTKDNIKATKLYEKSAGNGNAKASLAFWQLVKDIQKSQERASIKSPNRLFNITTKSVTQINVTSSSDANGAYPYDRIVVQSVHSRYFKKGNIDGRGLWYPDTQQFFSKSWVMSAKVPQCNHWNEYKWGFKYVPVKINLGGREVRGWKSNNNVPNNRVPQAYCIKSMTYPDTCKRTCKKWKQPEPNSYLLKSKKDALILFDMLVNGEKIIEQMPDTK